MLFLSLYLGYFLVKFYSVINIFSQQSMPLSSLIFSIVVFVIWTFIPVLGYLFAKLIGAKGKSSARILFIVGAVLGLFENVLFNFEFFMPYQGDVSIIMVMVLFFITAFISLKESSFLLKSNNK